MRKVLGLVVCLALTGSIASADTFMSNGPLPDMSKSAAKMSTPASREAGDVFLATGGRGGELQYKVNFIHTDGAVKVLVDVDGKDFKTVKRLGGHIEVRLYAGKDGGHLYSHLHWLHTNKLRFDGKKVAEFRASQVCIHAGNNYTRVLEVRASARMNNGDAMPFYKSNVNGKRIRVNCHASRWAGFTIID